MQHIKVNFKTMMQPVGRLLKVQEQYNEQKNMRMFIHLLLTTRMY